MPSWDFFEFHQVEVAAGTESCYAAVRRLDFGWPWSVRLLLALRGMQLLRGRLAPDRTMTIDDFLASGFLLLAERPGSEIVLGVVGKMWRIGGGERPPVSDAAMFSRFDEPGWAKAAVNFIVVARDAGSSVVTTETRVLATDEAAKRKFGRYWRVVGPFSAYTRRRVLATIRADAESI